MRRDWRVYALQLLLVVAAFAIWEWGFSLKPQLGWLIPDLLDPYFISRPSEIWQRLLRRCLLRLRGRLVRPGDLRGGVLRDRGGLGRRVRVARLVRHRC